MATARVNGAASSAGTYNATTNTTTATVVITDTSAENCSLIFNNTQRTAASATNTGITNVHLYRPKSEGASTSYSAGHVVHRSDPCHVEKNSASPRFMDQLGG